MKFPIFKLSYQKVTVKKPTGFAENRRNDIDMFWLKREKHTEKFMAGDKKT